MDLVVNHVLEALVVGRAEEHLSVHLAAGVAVVQHLRTKLQHGMALRARGPEREQGTCG